MTEISDGFWLCQQMCTLCTHKHTLIPATYFASCQPHQRKHYNFTALWCVDEMKSNLLAYTSWGKGVAFQSKYHRFLLRGLRLRVKWKSQESKKWFDNNVNLNRWPSTESFRGIECIDRKCQVVRHVFYRMLNCQYNGNGQDGYNQWENDLPQINKSSHGAETNLSISTVRNGS